MADISAQNEMDAIARFRRRRKNRLVQRMRQANMPEEARRLAIIIYTNCYRQDGGPGSGNWGHESVPGVRGGSKPGGGISHRQGSAEKGYTSKAKEKEKAKKGSKSGSYVSNHQTFSDLTRKHDCLDTYNNHFSQTYFENPTLDKAINGDNKNLVSSARTGVRDELQIYYTRTGETEKLQALQKDFKKCGSNTEKQRKFVEQYQDEYIAARESTFQQQLDELNSSERIEKAKEVLGKESKTTSKILDKCSGNPVSPSEYFDMQCEVLKSATPEQIALEDAWCNGNSFFDLNYTQYTSKKLSGEEINESEKRYEEIVSANALEVGAGKSVYRKTHLDELNAITGLNLRTVSDVDGIGEDELNGVTHTYNKLTAVGTAVQSNHFKDADVYIEYVTQDGAKFYPTKNGVEAECLLPVGATLSNMSIRKGTPKVPVIDSGKKLTVESKQWRTPRHTKDTDAYVQTPNYVGSKSYEGVVYLRVEVK